MMQYQLPKHPMYVRDEDDEFDNTYATIYFRFPPEYEADLKAFDVGQPWEPSKRWLDMIASMEGAHA